MCVCAGWLAGWDLARTKSAQIGSQNLLQSMLRPFDCVKKHHQMCVPDVGSDVCKIRATQRPGSHQICPDWVTKPSAKHASAIRLC